MNKEILRDVWQGQLPLCFRLHPDDVSGMHRPEPYYMMAPRVTYFPLVLDRVVKYFYRFMDHSRRKVDDMWLDYEGQPIKLQHPIGLSWDLFGSNFELPWRLILHFSDFPAKDLVRCNSETSIKTNFKSIIKEADALKHKGSIMMNMVEKDENQLWAGLVNNRFDQFWSINKRLMDKTDKQLFKNIPFRLYFPNYTYVQKLIKPCTNERHIFCNSERLSKPDDNTDDHSIGYDINDVILRQHKCSHTVGSSSNEIDPEHRSTTILDLIQVCFIDRLEDLLVSPPPASSKTRKSRHLEHAKIGENIDEDGKYGGHDNQESDTHVEELNSQANDAPDVNEDNNDSDLVASELIDVELFKYRFICHGIEIPFEAPLQWLSEHFSYPDNFLHISAVSKNKVDYL